MDKNKPTKCAKKNFLEKTAFLTRKIFKKSMETEKKNQMYLSCFKIFFFSDAETLFFLTEKGYQKKTYTRNRYEKRNFFVHDSEIKETYKNFMASLYFKNESKHFFEKFPRLKNKDKRILVRAKEKMPQGFYIADGNFLFCQHFNHKFFRTHSIKFYLTMLFPRNSLYSKIYKHSTKNSSTACFYHKLKRYKTNYVANARKMNYFNEYIQEKFVRSKSESTFIFPCNDVFHRLMSYRKNRNPRHKIILAPIEFLKLTGKRNEPTGTQFLKAIFAEEMSNVHALRETFNKMSLHESTKNTLGIKGNLKAKFFLKFFVFELFEKIKKDKKNSLFFNGLINRLLVVIIRTNGGNALAKNKFIHKKSHLFFDQMHSKEGQYDIESKIWLYSNKKIDNKYKMSVILSKKEEFGILLNFSLEAIQKNIVRQNLYPHFYKIMMHILSKVFVFPRGFYLEIACKCMEILKLHQLVANATFFFRLYLLKKRIGFFLHTHLNARLFFLIERAILFLAE